MKLEAFEVLSSEEIAGVSRVHDGNTNLAMNNKPFYRHYPKLELITVLIYFQGDEVSYFVPSWHRRY